MRRAGKVSILLLLATWASTAAAVLQLNTTLAAAQPEEYDEDGYKYGGKFVPNFESQPWKAKFVQFPYATCQAPYDTFSFVTKIRVCRDTDGFITGIKYWSEHPTRHHDPTTVCDVVGHEGATDCETLKLYTEDWKWRRYRTVTNIRTSKVKDGRDRWRVVYLAFSYSDGNGVEFGSYPQQHHAKHEQWFMKPEPGKICGMNGIYSMASICDAKSGYLQWVKPCGKCIPKPHNYKCDADYCTKAVHKKYKGGYKGDFEPDELYKDVYNKEMERIEHKIEKKLEKKYGHPVDLPHQTYTGDHGAASPPPAQYGSEQYDNDSSTAEEDPEQYNESGQYGEEETEAYEQTQKPLPLQVQVPQQQPQPQQQQQRVVQKQVPQTQKKAPLQQPVVQAPQQQQQQQQEPLPVSKHDKHEQQHQERKEKKQLQQQQQQQQQQQPQAKKGLFGLFG